jgi:hypothetical protein
MMPTMCCDAKTGLKVKVDIGSGEGPKLAYVATHASNGEAIIGRWPS